ncbi:hypothetical protein DFH09DRAFT_1157049 [Mycena vulgaris]|nr:hypothetical protein DFH09DRAFT_1157049 [Mycena vulgaris]
MISLLLTVLALALPFFVYAKLKHTHTPLVIQHSEEPLEIDALPSSSIDSENLRKEVQVAPADEPDTAGTQVSIRGGRAVQTASRRPVPATLPVDETVHVTPHERQMLEAMNTVSSDQFRYIRQLAKKFEDAVNAGDAAAQREIRLSIGTMCSYVKCGKPCLSPSGDKWTPKRCAGCLGNYYCSQQCQKADWKPRSQALGPGVYHKLWCHVIKNEYMPQLPYFQGQLTQFPWGRIERDGTFSNKFLQARLDVLDSDYRKAGFWAIPEQLNPHDVPDDPLYTVNAPSFKPAPQDNTGYAHGAMMLALEEWPSDVEGWKLRDEALIPHIFFSAEYPPPERPRPGQVKDWKSWYEWRALSLESPAAVLMAHVLTTYYLLTETLKVVNFQRPSGEKQVVDVHYLGAETELNYLPLFSELALLLPNTHINLTVFSPATHALLGRATQRHPRSIAARDGPVWEYTAPRRTGGGSIAISLYHPPPRPRNLPMQLRPFKGAWERSVMMLAPKDPDALVALNAGILSYSTWYEVVSCATMANIPFACTDYAQQSAQMYADHIPEWLKEASRSFSSDENMYQQLVKQRTRPVTTNPFHRPGQRPISQVRSPNLSNGFICKIV